MDYINNTSLVLNIENSNLLVSQEYLNTVSKPEAVIQGFYLSFNTEDSITHEGNVDLFHSENWSSNWREVTTTKTKSGVEIYVSNEDLPIDYIDSNASHRIKNDTHKYKYAFIGYKNLVTSKVKPVVSFKVREVSDEGVVIPFLLYNLHTSIVFDTNLICNYIFNVTKELEYMKTMEDDIKLSSFDRYSILDMKLKLQSYKNLGGVPSGDIYNGLLKY